MNHPPEIIDHASGSAVLFEVRDGFLRIFQSDDRSEALVEKGHWDQQRYDTCPKRASRLQLLPSIGEVVGRTFTARKRRGEHQLEILEGT